jgi:hypothetical protein
MDNRRVWSVFFIRHQKDYETSYQKGRVVLVCAGGKKLTLPDNQLEYTGESRRGVWIFVYLTTRCYQRRLNCVQRVVEWSWIVNWKQKCEDVSLLQHHAMTVYAIKQVGSRGTNSWLLFRRFTYRIPAERLLSWSRIMIILSLYWEMSKYRMIIYWVLHTNKRTNCISHISLKLFTLKHFHCSYMFR